MSSVTTDSLLFDCMFYLQKDTSGDYRKGLLLLCGGEDD